MRFEISSSGKMVLTEVSDADVLADSQMDYPGCPDGGWQYMAQDEEGGLSPLGPGERGEEWVTRDMYRIGQVDKYCRLGRDMSHPGYKQWPALVWTANQIQAVDISGEVAVVVAGTLGRAVVAIEHAGRRIWSAEHAFPEIIRFRISLQVRAGERVVITFRALKLIDNLTSIHYCWITKGENGRPTQGDPLHFLTARTVIDENWDGLRATIEDLTGAPSDLVAKIAYSDSPEFTLPQPVAPERAAYADPKAADRILGHSRLFSVDRRERP